jgi:hypothetical protein
LTSGNTLSAAIPESAFPKFIEGFQVLDSPILTGSHFAQVSAQFDKIGIAFQLFASFPGEDLIDLRQHKLSPLAIEFWALWADS